MNLVLILSLLVVALEAAQATNANITAWRHHRRQKRFLIYQNGGVIKLVTGCTFPVDFEEKRMWRQLVWLVNFQYQFTEPQKPIYWWNLWGGRDLKGPLALGVDQAKKVEPAVVVDEAQLFLYEFAEAYMQERGQNGRECLTRLICENAQMHEHSGLYAELLHRMLRPHHTLDARYLDAWSMGRHGVDCRSAYPAASHCLLDDYVHVHVRAGDHSFL